MGLQDLGDTYTRIFIGEQVVLILNLHILRAVTGVDF